MTITYDGKNADRFKRIELGKGALLRLLLTGLNLLVKWASLHICNSNSSLALEAWICMFRYDVAYGLIARGLNVPDTLRSGVMLPCIAATIKNH